MGRQTIDRLIVWTIVVVAAAALYDGLGLLRALQLNRALARVEAGEDVAAEHPRLEFARAWTLQQDGEFDAALKAYAAIEVQEDAGLRAAVHYNLANLYLRRALEHRADDADDLALPLVELAKEYYREVLRGNSEDWPAKYNLELALRIAPETELEAAEEERNPEHNPRSAAGIQVRERLP